MFKLSVQVLGTLLTLVLAITILGQLYNVLLVGQYWATATLLATFVVAFLVPVATVAATAYIIIQLWKLK